MDREQIKKVFDNPQACNGRVSVDIDTWNILAKAVHKAISELEEENMNLRAELDAMTDMEELQAVGLPGVNIETMNVTVNYYAEL